MEEKVNADPSDLAEQVRAAVLGAALAAYEDAGMRGVCAEGAWEVALGAMGRSISRAW